MSESFYWKEEAYVLKTENMLEKCYQMSITIILRVTGAPFLNWKKYQLRCKIESISTPSDKNSKIVVLTSILYHHIPIKPACTTESTPKHYGVQPAADTKEIMSWQVRSIWTCFSINRQIMAVYLTKWRFEWRFETVWQEGAGAYMGVWPWCTKN